MKNYELSYIEDALDNNVSLEDLIAKIEMTIAGTPAEFLQQLTKWLLSDVELKPCPFCEATEDILEIDTDVDSNCSHVVCNYNKGGCGGSGGYRNTVTEATDDWNQRV